MECPGTLLCNRCGLEAQVVMSHGFDRRGKPVLRPALVETEEGLFVFLDCLVHGRIAQSVACAGDVDSAKQSLKEIPAGGGLSGALASGQIEIARPPIDRSWFSEPSSVELPSEDDVRMPRKPK